MNFDKLRVVADRTAAVPPHHPPVPPLLSASLLKPKPFEPFPKRER
jgi:hypothetical protein